MAPMIPHWLIYLFFPAAAVMMATFVVAERAPTPRNWFAAGWSLFLFCIVLIIMSKYLKVFS